MTKFEQIINSVYEYGTERSEGTKLEVVNFLRNNAEEAITYLSTKYKRITTRIFVLAYSFAVEASLEEVEKLLNAYNCERLYDRNLPEISLIYAFNKGISFDEWAKIYYDITLLYNKVKPATDIFEKGVRTCDLIKYIKENSDSGLDDVFTSIRTHKIRSAVLKANNSKQLFDIIDMNIYKFSPIRERARAYFIQYLLAYVNNIVGTQNEKWILQNSKTDKDNKINFKALFIELDNYYNNSFIEDRIQVIYETIMDWNTENMKKTIDELVEDGIISAKDALELLSISDENIDKATIKKCEKYEDYLRDIVKGKKDISREMFVAALTFFNSHLSDEDNLKFDIFGLNNMLEKSGWQIIDGKKAAFDSTIEKIIADPNCKDEEIAVINEKLTFEGLEPILYLAEGKGYNDPQQERITKALK